MKRKLFTLLMLLVSVFAVVAISNTKEANAVKAGEKLYFTPSGDWNQSGAWYSAVFVNSSWSIQEWVAMTDENGDGVHECVVPSTSGITHVQFQRMKNTAKPTDLNWNSKWNSSGTIQLDSSKNHLKLNAGWSDPMGTWHTYTYVAPEFNLVGTMNGWNVGDKNLGLNDEDGDGIYHFSIELAAGEHQFKIAQGYTWSGAYGYTSIVNGSSDLLSDAGGNDHNILLNAATDGLYTFIFDMKTKKITVEVKTYAELNAELATLLTKYYNNGTYTRNTVINLNADAQEELISCFHAQVNMLVRDTYFKGDALWMLNEEGTYSYYGTSGSNMTGGRVVNVGETTDSIAKVGVTMEEYYTTMMDISAASTTAVKWTKSGNVWSCDNEAVIKLFLDFTAPCFLGLSGDKAQYFSLHHVEVEETASGLVLRLVTIGDQGKLTDANGVLSVATIK